MPDIFNRQVNQHGGSFSADSATLSFPNVTGVPGQSGFAGSFGLLVQQLGMSYQQQVTRLYEVGSNRIYYVGGRVAGNFTLGRIIGPSVIAQAFYLKYGDICQAASNQLSFEFSIGCTPDSPRGEVAYDAKFCVITGIDIRISADNMNINENVGMMFSALEYRLKGAGANP